MPSNYYLDIETNKNKSAKLNFANLSCESNKKDIVIDFLHLEKDEYLESCFRIDNLLD